ncbi:hypothetical protein MIR68_006509 [Amoeboaphelidium protococcarum]|nr:hypothetical protein MIR68_006509 [Amoeboaphelidium protococcarum]
MQSLRRRIRNIGIMAHIDAGKTTLTERMLYLAGVTRKVGDVDDGNTQMDYLEQEQERGITIQSAATTFEWNLSQSQQQQEKVYGENDASSCQINLIDSPGHHDFTFEVQRAVSVLDSGVCLLDAVSGVQAQTKTVWKQANNYNLSRLIYVNKMDKAGSNYAKCISEAQQLLPMSYYDDDDRTQCQVLSLCLPLYKNQHSEFAGVCNLVEGVVYLPNNTDSDVEYNVSVDKAYSDHIIDEQDLSRIQKAKQILIDQLIELDDQFLEVALEHDTQQIPEQYINDAIRRLCIGKKAIPMLCGTAHKGIGVSQLLNAINLYLPNPQDMPAISVQTTSTTGNSQKGYIFKVDPQCDQKDLCAQVFKVIHDKNKGALIYTKVLQGSLRPNMQLFNSSKNLIERCDKIYQVHANKYQHVDQLVAGQIGVLSGLKSAQTGDTLLNQNAKSKFQLPSIPVPQPLFSASIEPENSIAEKQLTSALAILTREDPSLQVVVDADSNQTILRGMGELHLEIIAERLRSEFGVNFSLGNVWINYQESIKDGRRVELEDFQYQQSFAGRFNSALVSIAMTRQSVDQSGPNTLSIAKNAIQNQDGPLSYQKQRHDQLLAHLRRGIDTALSAGPLMSYPVTSVQVDIQKFVFESQSSSEQDDKVSGMAVSQAVRHALQQNALLSDTTGESIKKCPFTLLEPVMSVAINVPSVYMGVVLQDLSGNRRAQILTTMQQSTYGEHMMDDDADLNTLSPLQQKLLGILEQDYAGSMQLNKASNAESNITALVPLQEMLGYSNTLKSLTKGYGSFQMDLDRYQPVEDAHLLTIVKGYRGY